MSLTQSTPLLLSAAEIDEFSACITRDFAIARSHQKNGKYELVVTPKKYVVRLAEKSSVRADLDGFTCSMAKSLIKLYEQKCPADIEVKAIVEKTLRTPLGDQQEDVYMLRVRFTFKQRARKGRRFS